MLPSGTNIDVIPMLSESSGLNQLQKKRVNISSPQSSARRQERNYKQHAAEKLFVII
jgi:hypothetical protein